MYVDFFGVGGGVGVGVRGFGVCRETVFSFTPSPLFTLGRVTNRCVLM